jgi:SAM-dependent methyltransferase
MSGRGANSIIEVVKRPQAVSQQLRSTILARSPVRRRQIMAAVTHLRPVRMGSLRRLTPISRHYGFDRGQPVDRHYIEQFLGRFSGHPGYAEGCVQGRVLEVGGREYVERFGTLGDHPAPGVVHRVDVLHESSISPEATIVGSLTEGDTVPADTFDCIICTQTLHVIFDFRAALETLHAGLRPGGTLLLTVPGITGTCRPDRDYWGDWWRFTSLSLRRLLEERFPAADVHVEAYGNVLSAVAFLHGMATHELSPQELDVRDPDYEVVLAARASKASTA